MVTKSRGKRDKMPARATDSIEPIPPSGDVSRDRDPWVGYWPAVAGIGLALAVLELLFQTLIPGSALRNGEIPLGGRLALLCYELAILSAFVVGAAAAVILTVRSTRLLPALISRYPNGVTLSRAALLWFLLLLYGASWAKFWHTGRFLSHLDFAFVLPHPIQIFHWIGPEVVLTVLGANLIATAVLGQLIPRWIASWHPKLQARLVCVSVALVGITIFGAIVGELYSGLEKRQWTRSGILYAGVRDQSGGPFAFTFTPMRKLAGRPLTELGTAAKLQIIQRPIIPMSQYAAALDGRLGKRWNVILIMVESLGANQLGSHGSPREVMPAVEALAANSRVFLNAYTQSSHTSYATPVPLSSHYPLRSAADYGYPKNPSYPRVLIYDVLKTIGYRTAIFSSSNEYWAGMINYLQTGHLDRFFHAANFKGPTYAAAGDTGFAAWVRDTKHAGSVDDRYTVAEAIQWLDKRGDEPFFLYLNLQNSHLPYVVPADFPRRFSSEKVDFTIRFGHIPAGKIEHVKNAYADSLAYVDAQIARLFEHLRRRGLWDRTVIVLTGDHGQAFHEHGFSAHAGPIYNEVMKVPLIVSAPGLQAGPDERLSQHADIAPSILDLLGLPPHPGFQGMSLFDASSSRERSIYMVAQTPQAHQIGIVRDRYKLIYDEWQQRYELYDLASDPAEKHNLALQRPALVKKLGGRLHAWRKLQLEYYADKNLQSRLYPPILEE